MTRLKSCKLVLLSVIAFSHCAGLITLDGVCMYVECKNETDKNVSGAEPLYFLDVFVWSLPAAQVTYLLHLRSNYYI